MSARLYALACWAVAFPFFPPPPFVLDFVQKSGLHKQAKKGILCNARRCAKIAFAQKSQSLHKNYERLLELALSKEPWEYPLFLSISSSSWPRCGGCAT
jgi:hypothetical protein